MWLPAGWSILLALVACEPKLASVEVGEWLPGGDTTNTLLLGNNAFLRAASNLTPEHESLFYGGNSFFNDSWVEAPSSTAHRDGLGPLFNARGCSGCHFRDGRAAPPESGSSPTTGLLFRISTPDGQPDATFGGQLQDQALPGLAAEVVVSIVQHAIEGELDDGTSYSLSAPEYRFDETDFGPLPARLDVSPRIAPQMVGLGLLEAVPLARLQELEDPNDSDRDGISGRIQWREDAGSGELLPGRFGWKGDAPTIEHQVAAAFNGDLGITSRLFPDDDCTDAQPDCLAEPNGGEPELEDHILERVVLYSRAVAVPVRREWEGDEVLRGKWLFTDLGCASCHVPQHTTGAFPALPEFEGQHIWPYTDLLLHDMGPDLADDRPLGEASGSEWRTPPLWSLGLIPEVNGHSRYLHDGRARSLEEAILWHGGEAELAQHDYLGLDALDRSDLLRFLESL